MDTLGFIKERVSLFKDFSADRLKELLGGVNNDAAFDRSGDLTAIPAFGAMFGYTHKWSDSLRSTASYGYVNLDNEFSQGGHAYHTTHYGSLNLVWQLRKRLSVGLEALYGHKEEKSGADGDAFRIQVGLLYSLFD